MLRCRVGSGLLKPFAHEPRTYGRPPIPPKSVPLRLEHAPWLLEWRFLSLVISFGFGWPRTKDDGPTCKRRRPSSADLGSLWIAKSGGPQSALQGATNMIRAATRPTKLVTGRVAVALGGGPRALVHGACAITFQVAEVAVTGRYVWLYFQQLP